MERRLLDFILCPECGGTLELKEAIFAEVKYERFPLEEVQSGMVICLCGRTYPVTDFVLSFDSLFPPILRREAAFWERYYLWLLEQESYGFHDLRRGLAPYITAGVSEPFPAADILDRYDIHYRVAEHALLHHESSLLDIGVGLGWTSLHFARSGYQVTAFEPSLGTVKAAKRYAMEQGVFIEYICASLETIKFTPGSFHNVTAFHSLHHVPELEAALREVQVWLDPAGTLAVDEHVGNSRLAAALGSELNCWAEQEVFPRYRNIPPETLADLPQEPHSVLEDSSVDKVVPCLNKLFDVRETWPRHVFLDHYPLLYYMHTGRDLAAFKHALAVSNQFQEMVRDVDPDGGDYITIIAKNSTSKSAGDAANGAGHATPLAEPQLMTSTPFESELEAQLAAQSVWAQDLEQELQRKTREITQLKKTIRHFENGRVMRLLLLFRRTQQLLRSRRLR